VKESLCCCMSWATAAISLRSQSDKAVLALKGELVSLHRDVLHGE
jgi:hypothetical protein